MLTSLSPIVLCCCQACPGAAPVCASAQWDSCLATQAGHAFRSPAWGKTTARLQNVFCLDVSIVRCPVSQSELAAARAPCVAAAVPFIAVCRVLALLPFPKRCSTPLEGPRPHGADSFCSVTWSRGHSLNDKERGAHRCSCACPPPLVAPLSAKQVLCVDGLFESV